MSNPVYYHCPPFTDSYKGFTCAELRPLLTVRQVRHLIFWKARLLVVPAGLNPRPSEAQGRYSFILLYYDPNK